MKTKDNYALYFSLLNSMKESTGPLFQSVKVPLGKGALCTIIQVTNYKIAQDWLHYQPPSTPLVSGLQLQILIADHNPLGLEVQTVFSQSHLPLSALYFVSLCTRMFQESLIKVKNNTSTALHVSTKTVISSQMTKRQIRH